MYVAHTYKVHTKWHYWSVKSLCGTWDTKLWTLGGVNHILTKSNCWNRPYASHTLDDFEKTPKILLNDSPTKDSVISQFLVAV